MPWKKTMEPNRPLVTMRRIPFAYWIPKATNTHPEYLTIIAFPLQHWLHERASMSRYTCTACLVEYPLGNEKRITARSTIRNNELPPIQTDIWTDAVHHVNTLRSNDNSLIFTGEYKTYTRILHTYKHTLHAYTDTYHTHTYIHT